MILVSHIKSYLIYFFVYLRTFKIKFLISYHLGLNLHRSVLFVVGVYIRSKIDNIRLKITVI